MRKTSTQWKSKLEAFWYNFSRNKMAVISLAWVIFVSMIGILAPYLTPYSPLDTSAQPLLPPSTDHYLGTDFLGRDFFSELAYGIRVSLVVGLLSVAISAVLGLIIGSLAGYFEGILGGLLMRLADVFLAIPRFMLAILLVAFFGGSLWMLIIALGLTGWASAARLVRADFLSLKTREFVDAASVMGLSDLKIVFSEILPNVAHTIIVTATLEISLVIKMEAGLTYLGLGDANLISWGRMLSDIQRFIFVAPIYMVALPGLAIFSVCFAFNVIGDSLNEYLNPKLRKR